MKAVLAVLLLLVVSSVTADLLANQRDKITLQACYMKPDEQQCTECCDTAVLEQDPRNKLRGMCRQRCQDLN